MGGFRVRNDRADVGWAILVVWLMPSLARRVALGLLLFVVLGAGATRVRAQARVLGKIVVRLNSATEPSFVIFHGIAINLVNDVLVGGVLPESEAYAEAIYFFPADSHDAVLVARAGNPADGPNVVPELGAWTELYLDRAGNMIAGLSVGGVEGLWRWNRATTELEPLLQVGDECPADAAETVSSLRETVYARMGGQIIVTPGTAADPAGDAFFIYQCTTIGAQWARVPGGSSTLEPLFAPGTTVAGPQGQTMELQMNDVMGPLVVNPRGDRAVWTRLSCQGGGDCLGAPYQPSEAHGIVAYDAATSSWSSLVFDRDPSFTLELGPTESIGEVKSLSISETGEIGFYADLFDDRAWSPNPAIFVTRDNWTRLAVREGPPVAGEPRVAHLFGGDRTVSTFYMGAEGEVIFSATASDGTVGLYRTLFDLSLVDELVIPGTVHPIVGEPIWSVDRIAVGADGSVYTLFSTAGDTPGQFLHGRPFPLAAGPAIYAAVGDTLVDTTNGDSLTLETLTPQGVVLSLGTTYGTGANMGYSTFSGGTGADGRGLAASNDHVLALNGGAEAAVILIKRQERGAAVVDGDGAVRLAGSYEPGQLVFDITAYRPLPTGPGPSQFTQLELTLPDAELSVDAASLPSGCAPVVDGARTAAVQCTEPFALSADETRAFRIPVTIPTFNPELSYEATVVATVPGDPNLADNTATVVVGTDGADLAVTVVSGPRIRGAPVTFRLENLGPVAANDIVAELDVSRYDSPSVVVRGMGACAESMPDADTKRYTCSLAALAADAAVMFDCTDADYSDVIFTVSSGTVDPDPSNNTVTVPRLLDPTPPPTGGICAAAPRRGRGRTTPFAIGTLALGLLFVRRR